MLRGVRIAVLVALLGFFSSNLYAVTGNTDQTHGVKPDDLMKNPYCDMKYDVTKTIDTESSREKPELAHLIILLKEGYEFKGTATGDEEVKKLSKMKLGECVKDYIEKTKLIPFCSGFVTITPISNHEEIVGHILKRDEGVTKVSWWLQGNEIELEVEYEPTWSGE